ncbi:Nuclear factor 1 A type [Schistosoma japonicum]|nr:Nuclear factor 1 A type [Schistosoma japonicum]
MEPNNINVKAEPSFSNLSAGLTYTLSIPNPNKDHLSPLCTVIQDDSFLNSSSICMPPVELSQSDSNKLDTSIAMCLPSQTKVEFYSSEPDICSHNSFPSSTDSGTKSLPTHCIEESSTILSVQSSLPSHCSDFQVPNLPVESLHKLPVHTTPKPSEALFVRALIGRCKRIAPLWFRGVSSMRERNREENRRMACNSGQSQSDWSLIALKIGEMNSGNETDAISNLLKKLYKELPSDSVFWFLKCWLGSEDTLNDPDSCVISRGDAKGRMRRIDGGKGSDKVWRLDTIVGMLYHGLPMSSTDTNIMVHTCDHELCVRPQHIRFRASSVALVVVLKALAQAGYTIIPPTVAAGSNGIAPNAPDESVDVFGPFSIEQLQQYRSENLNPASESISKLTLNASDRELIDLAPVIKDALQKSDPIATNTSINNFNRANSYPNSYTSYNYHKSHKLDQLRDPSTTMVNNSKHSTQQRSTKTTTSNGFTFSPMSTSKCNLELNNSTVCCTTLLPVRSDTGSLIYSKDTNGISLKSERYSLKRPRPLSPSSFPSSPAKISTYNFHPSSSPPLLISEIPFSSSSNSNSSTGSNSSNSSRTSQIHPQIRRPSDSTLIINGNVSSLITNNSVSLTCANSNNNRTTSSAFYAVSMHDNSIGLPRSLQSASVPAPATTSIVIPALNNLLSHTNSISNDQVQSISHHFHPDQSSKVHSPFVTLPSSSPLLLHHQPCTIQQGSFTKENSFLCSQPYLGLIVSGPVNGLHIYPSPLNTATTTTVTTNNTGTISLINSSGYSSSGKSTPRQPAKKRPEARTPTIDGSLTDENLLLYPLSNSLTVTSAVATTGLCNVDDSQSHLSATSGSSSTSGSTITNTFMVHYNTPFVPVHGRIGRPSSTEDLIHINSGYLNSNPGSNSLSSTSTKSMTTNSLNNSPKYISEKHQLANANINSSTDHDDRIGNDGDTVDDDEGEMDQELVDIMVGRNAVTASVASNFSFSSNLRNSIKSQLVQHQMHPLLLNHHSSEINNSDSPDGRRVIAAMVAALANVGESPLMDSSTPVNSRRSASACSLPHFDINSHEDSVDLFPHNNHLNNSTINLHQNHHNNQYSRLSHFNHNHQSVFNNNLKHSFNNIENELTNHPHSGKTIKKSLVEEREGVVDDGQPLTPPPPKLMLSSLKLPTPSAAVTTASSTASFSESGDHAALEIIPKLPSSINYAVNNNNYNSNNTSGSVNEFSLNIKDSSPQESMQELACLLRNSPASGISQELIDMLANMAQQYGMQQSRTGSRASRPSSQVAQRFYRSLVNGSVCGSPFSVSGSTSSNFNFLHTPNSCGGGVIATCEHNASTTPLNCANQTNGMISSNNNYSTLSINHFNSLSFTPLSIDDPDSSQLVISQPSTCTNHEFLLTNNNYIPDHHCSSPSPQFMSSMESFRDHSSNLLVSSTSPTTSTSTLSLQFNRTN